MSARIRKSMEEKIAAGDLYDAQQLAKTVHSRLCAKGDCAEAADFVVECAARFSQHGQHDLAADLGKDIVQSYVQHRVPTTEENLERVERLLARIPARAATVPKYAALQQALRWSARSAAGGHPRLHRLAAESYWAEEEYGKSQAHLVYCGDGPALARLIREWRARGYPNEEDLFSLRALLMLMSLNDLVTAHTFWDASYGDVLGAAASPACASSSRAGAPPESSEAAAVPGTPPPQPEPPVQCGTFLLAAAEAGDLQFFRIVRGKYALVFRRDSSFEKYLDEIEVQVFSAGHSRSDLGAIFDALLGGSGDRGADGIATVQV